MMFQMKMINGVSMCLLLLGLAFFGGAFLAYLQHVIAQITILACIGTVSVVLAAVIFAVGHLALKM